MHGVGESASVIEVGSEKEIGKSSEICAMERNVTADARFRDLYATCSCSFAITSHLSAAAAVAPSAAIDGMLLPITTFTRIRYYELRFEIRSAIFEAADVHSLVRSFVCFAFAVILQPTHCSMF